MNNWLRYEDGVKRVYQGMAITLVFFIFAFIYSVDIMAAVFGALFMMFICQNVYYQNVGKNLKVVPPKNQHRFLIGAENTINFEFENGKIPIWNAVLTLSIEDAVAPQGDELNHISGNFDVIIPFAIGSKEKIKIAIPLVGRKRGLARVTRLTVEIPNVFGDGSLMMQLIEPIKQENLVYPKIIPFRGQLQPSPFRPGEVEQRNSLFHDAFQPVGTRDYLPTDRFDQIHWTASARMQTLQTKEYQPVASHSVLFLLNAIEKPRTRGDFEKKIERLASYVDYCTRMSIPYAVVINVRTFGAVPYIHIPTGTGKIQYQKTLEMLALLSERNGKIPFENMLRSVDAKGILPPSIVLITHEPERFIPISSKWARYNHVIVDSTYEGSDEIWNQENWKDKGTV